MTHLPDYAPALYAALRPDPFYRRLEEAVPADTDRRAAMLDYYTLSMQEAARWGRLGLPEKGVWGASVWATPLNPEDQALKAAEKRAGLEKALGPAAADVFARIEANMAPHEDALGVADHWYLSILGVDPALQGGGRGGALLREVLAEADAAGRASYLTTFTPRNISFYERQGYRSAGAFPEPETGADFHVLIRQPR